MKKTKRHSVVSTFLFLSPTFPKFWVVKPCLIRKPTIKLVLESQYPILGCVCSHWPPPCQGPTPGPNWHLVNPNSAEVVWRGGWTHDSRSFWLSLIIIGLIGLSSFGCLGRRYRERAIRMRDDACCNVFESKEERMIYLHGRYVVGCWTFSHN